MTVTYATYSEFTQVYSLRGVSETDITSYWLPYGALRVNENLGGYFSTLPFSSNNETAKDLSIHHAYLGILNRQRTGSTEDLKVKQEITDRLVDLRQGNTPMIMTDGTALYSDTARVDAWSTTQNYENTFNQLRPIEQQVDPDLVDDLITRLD